MNHRLLQDIPCEPVARVRQALASPQLLAEIPRDVDIVADCRGHFCLLSDAALKLLREQGDRARKTFDGLTEGRAPGLPLASGIDRR